MIPVSQFGRTCSALSKKKRAIIQKLYDKIYKPIAIEHWVLLWNAQWWCFPNFYISLQKPHLRLYLLEPQLVPAWAEASEPQWLISPCLFLFSCAIICWNVHNCSSKDLYPLSNQETVIWMSMEEKTTPSGLYRSSQSFTHRMIFSYRRDVTGGTDLITSDSTLIPVISDSSYKYSLLS